MEVYIFVYYGNTSLNTLIDYIENRISQNASVILNPS